MVVNSDEVVVGNVSLVGVDIVIGTNRIFQEAHQFLFGIYQIHDYKIIRRKQILLSLSRQPNRQNRKRERGSPLTP